METCHIPQRHSPLQCWDCISPTLTSLWGALTASWKYRLTQYTSALKCRPHKFSDNSSNQLHNYTICNYPIRIQSFITAQNYGVLDFVHSLGLKNWNTKFRKLALFPSSRKGRKMPTLLGPLERSYMYNYLNNCDRFCGLLVWVPGCRAEDPVCCSRRYQVFWIVVGLERGSLSLVKIMNWKN
jgi:hypothetical protein